jgi:hypothetical protein
MSYGTKYTDTFRRAGLYTGPILKSTKVAELPVELTSRIRTYYQPQNSQNAPLNRAPHATRPRRRGDRVRVHSESASGPKTEFTASQH